jgi:hypothetical protein
MQQNVGVFDQTLRVGLGYGLLTLAFLVPKAWSWWALAGFVVFAVSGYAGRCLVYRALGLRTC